MDPRWFLPIMRCQFTSWPKELDKILNFGFKFVEDMDSSLPPSEGGKMKGCGFHW